MKWLELPGVVADSPVMIPLNSHYIWRRQSLDVQFDIMNVMSARPTQDHIGEHVVTPWTHGQYSYPWQLILILRNGPTGD